MTLQMETPCPVAREGADCHDFDAHNFTSASLWRKVECATWIVAYTTEEARQRYADRRQRFRQAGACILLAVLRLMGVRYV